MKRIAKPSFDEDKFYTSPRIVVIQLDSEAVICQASINFGNPGGAGADILDDNINDGGDF